MSSVIVSELGLPHASMRSGRLERDLTRLTRLLQRALGERVHSILVVGSIGRASAEGRAPSAREIEDYDLVAVVDHLGPVRRALIRRRLAERLTQTTKAGLPVSLGIVTLDELPALPFTLFNYEMRYGYRVLFGRDPTPAMPDFDSAEMPLIEATRLLLNRGVYVWGDALLLKTGDPGDEELRAIAHRKRKAWMAIGDALIIGDRSFHWSYGERIAAARRCTPLNEIGGEELLGRYVRAHRDKISGAHEVVDRTVLRDELRELLSVHETVFRFIEEMRLGRAIDSWRRYAEEICSYPDYLLPALPRRIVRLGMAFGLPRAPEFVLYSPRRAPEEVLLRAFPALAYRGARDPRFLGRHLNWRPRVVPDPLTVWERFHAAWARGR